MKKIYIKMAVLILLAFSMTGCGLGMPNGKNKNFVDITPSIEGYYENSKWSPNGRYIAFTKVIGELWLYDIETKTYEHIKEVGTVDKFTWKNSDVIGYFNGKAFYEISLTDRIPELRMSGGNLCITLSWDSKREKYFMTLSDSNSYWYKNGQLEPIENIPEKVTSAAFSPNNKWLAFNHNPGDRLSEISLLNVEKDEVITRYKPDHKDMLIRSLTWSPDNQWIAFYGGPSKELTGIYMMSREGHSPPEKIFDIGVGHLDWSPRSDQLVATTIGSPGRNRILILDLPEKYKVNRK
ncbi:MAG: PD40 domain-containing protein [Bacillaceae bacterium]|nr:PD40 domain-containing protein [Bacillaceae bacterium]